MKKLLFFLMIGICTLTYGQKLSVTPDGLKDADDPEKTFLVINVEGKTAQQLYDNALKYINKTYKDPEQVIKGKTEGEYLKFITHVPEFLFVKNSGMKVFFASNYTTELSFKDGKVKYEILNLEMYNPNNMIPLYFVGGGLDWFIYNKKGDLKREEAKTQIEDYFKGEIYKLSEALKGTNDNW